MSMRIVGFLFFSTLTVCLIWILNSSSTASWLASSISKKEMFLPPIGKLISPSSGFWKNAESEKGPNLTRYLRNKNLQGPVLVSYDDRMVPHIFAENSSDAFFAQGYVTASLRLWQMEFQTHAISGRLAEFLGTKSDLREILLEKDRKTRLEGLPRAAEKSVELWKKDKEHYALLESYAAGVNAYINSLSYSELPLEYKILDYRPEQWSTLKTALLLKAMADDLTSRDEDFEMTYAYQKFGKAKFQELYPDYFQEQLPIIMDTSAYHFTPIAVSDSVMLPFSAFQKPKSIAPVVDSIEKNDGLGSNNWAVAGKKTASGNPMLCNDPHLGMNLPSIWFELQIVTPHFNVYGASLPGAPGIISGFNENVAWGVTNVSHDVRDWYAIKWADDSKKEYIFDGKAMPTKFILDTIWVRGKKEPVVDTLLYTHFGPVAKRVDGQDYVLHWLANDPSNEPLTFFALMQAKNYQDYRKAIQHFSCPAQNLVFACKDGDIALTTQGKLPLRRPNQGKFIADGSLSFDQWSGFIPQEQIPHEHNPSKGFVASANQHSVSPDSPYETYGYFEEYRGRFLNTKLAAMANIETKDMKALQRNNFSLKAQDFLPLMLKYINRGALSKEELELLSIFKEWNFEYTNDLVVPTIFEDWFYNFKISIYDEIVDARNAGVNVRFPEDWFLLGVIKRDTSNFIVDKASTPEKESLVDILIESFKQTYKTVPRNDKNEILKWGDMKATQIMHLARIKPFSRFNVPVDGTKDALNAVSNRYDFKASREKGKAIYKDGSSSGPSWCMVVELGNNVNGYAIYPGGQSGNPGSYYYDNMIADWAAGKYYNLLIMKDLNDGGDRVLFKQSMKK